MLLANERLTLIFSALLHGPDDRSLAVARAQRRLHALSDRLREEGNTSV